MANPDLNNILQKMEIATSAEVNAKRSGYAKAIDTLRANGVGIDDPPTFIKIGDTTTVRGSFKDFKIDIVLGPLDNPKSFDTITIGGKVWWAYNDARLRNLKRKLLEARKTKSEHEKRKDERRQVKFSPEFGGLERFLKIDEETVKMEEEVEKATGEEKTGKGKKGEDDNLTLSERVLLGNLERLDE